MPFEMWKATEDEEPIVAVALHEGHELREEIAEIMALSEADRLREEDPYTGALSTLAPTRIVVQRSRFEVDLNRPREKAVYLRPEEAWGLQVWEENLPSAILKRSLAQYDAFYAEAHRLFSEMERHFRHFVILELHTYNHRRSGPAHPPEDPLANPEVNLGTHNLDRARWSSLLERFLSDLRGFDFLGRSLDVRENIKFRGGHFSSWVRKHFPHSACCLNIEFKKFFMDEWTGKLYAEEYATLRQLLRATLPGLRENLARMGHGIPEHGNTPTEP